MKAPPHHGRFRPPTASEIDKRVRAFMWWVGLAAYVMLGVGGLIVFDYHVHDPAWQEIFYSSWWMPSGFAAFWLKITIENHLVGWVPDTSMLESDL